MTHSLNQTHATTRTIIKQTSTQPLNVAYLYTTSLVKSNYLIHDLRAHKTAPANQCQAACRATPTLKSSSGFIVFTLVHCSICLKFCTSKCQIWYSDCPGCWWNSWLSLFYFIGMFIGSQILGLELEVLSRVPDDIDLWARCITMLPSKFDVFMIWTYHLFNAKCPNFNK